MITRILAVALGAALFAGSVSADIQNPPMDKYTPVNKLGRGLGNIAFGVSEIPDTMKRVQRVDGNNAAWSVGLVNGTWRTIRRVGHGAWEVVTFPLPTQKGTYRQSYKRGELYPTSGLKEYAPELGFQNRTTYSRTNN